ncbi:MAG: hypothetical protein EBS00_03570 [Verrucomicrobia bacterium]|nr:hypothetical protein [Verrucomicrobiota bacterium]
MISNPVTSLTFEGSARHYAESILGQSYGDGKDLGFWLAVAMVAIYVPLLGRLAAKHFFGKEGSLMSIGLTGLLSIALTFCAICMADTSLSAFAPKSIETLMISLCTGTVVLLVTSAAGQVLSMAFGPSLGLQLIFWNIVFLAHLATKFLTDFWKHF